MTRSIGIVTSARSDFGLLKPLMDAVRNDSDLSLIVYATGMHFSERHGSTIDEITEAGFGGFLIEVPAAPEDDSAAAAVRAAATALKEFAACFADNPPDLLVVMGDRFDMMPAVTAALPFTIAVAHLAGGELTAGVTDDMVRHAVTKMSHLHFPTMQEYADRLINMGEESWRITISGEPGLDALNDFPFEDKKAVFDKWGFRSDKPLTMFTLHPETLNPGDTAKAIKVVLEAARHIETQILMTYPNADPSSDQIIEAIESFAVDHDHCRVAPHLGRDNYLNIMKHADCMVGNSSSGIVEAASFRMPVVDVGRRQGGRLKPENVIETPFDAGRIANTWTKALSSDFRAELDKLVNPYGDGQAIPRILQCLKDVELDQSLMIKRFVDRI